MSETKPVNQAAEMIKISSLSHAFGQQAVLHDIDLSLKAGEVVAILGPNGAGKTTLINILLGVHQPTAGSAHLFSMPAGSLAVRQRIGVMLQQAELADTLTVEELIRQFSSYYLNPLSVPQLLEMAGMQDKATRRYNLLSGGEKRRCQFAIALAGKPDLLFLDEPTTGLDVQARRTLWDSVRDYATKGAGVVLTTHYLEEADVLADRIIVLNNGRIMASATPTEIKQRVSLKRLTCRTQLDIESLRKHDLVNAIEMHRDNNDGSHTLNIMTPAVEDLLRYLLNNDCALSELHVSGADLEQAFLALTETEQE